MQTLCIAVAAAVDLKANGATSFISVQLVPVCVPQAHIQERLEWFWIKNSNSFKSSFLIGDVVQKSKSWLQFQFNHPTAKSPPPTPMNLTKVLFFTWTNFLNFTSYKISKRPSGWTGFMVGHTEAGSPNCTLSIRTMFNYNCPPTNREQAWPHRLRNFLVFKILPLLLEQCALEAVKNM